MRLHRSLEAYAVIYSYILIFFASKIKSSVYFVSNMIDTTEI